MPMKRMLLQEAEAKLLLALRLEPKREDVDTPLTNALTCLKVANYFAQKWDGERDKGSDKGGATKGADKDSDSDKGTDKD